VLLSGPGDGTWHAAGEQVAKRLGVPLTCLRVGPGAEHDLAPEPGADWAALHDVAADGAVLVRPDGFVAWRATGAAGEPEPVLADVVKRLLSMP
jgi:putative polyketide hydroxylase